MTRKAKSTMTYEEARALTDRIREGFKEQAVAYTHKKEKKKEDDRKVYAILAWNSRKVKIGVAANPHDRITQIRTMSPEPLELIAVTAGGGEKLEKSLHKRFDSIHSHGEWFHLTSELMEILLTEKMWLAIK